MKMKSSILCLTLVLFISQGYGFSKFSKVAAKCKVNCVANVMILGLKRQTVTKNDANGEDFGAGAGAGIGGWSELRFCIKNIICIFLVKSVTKHGRENESILITIISGNSKQCHQNFSFCYKVW